MNDLVRWFSFVLVASFATGQSYADAPAPLRVMSFNVRYGTAADGDNHWDKRKMLVVKTIRAFDPDLLGMQEVVDFQAEFLGSHLPDYTRVGVGRDDGQREGEQMTILFKTDRFENLATGHFWLSERPDRPGVKGWDAECARMVTWARLRDRNTDRCFLWLNTHWDHRGAQARIESPKVMRQWLAKQQPRLPLIITGDFNSHEGSPRHQTLLGQDGDEPKLVDTYRKVHPERQPDEATSHAFDGKTTGNRIDWILVSPEFTVEEATIDHFNKDKRYPSDHYPVTAILR